jgi:AraC-like DNA-binding protein
VTVTLVPERLIGADYMAPNIDVIVEHEHLPHRAEDLHWHDFHKLVCIIGGSGTHVLNGVPFAIKQGVSFLLTPSDFHAWRPGVDGCDLYNILFSPRTLSQYLDAKLFSGTGLAPGALVARDMDAVEPVLATMLAESERHSPDARLSLECLLQHVLVEFVRHAATEDALEVRAGSGMHGGVRQALTFMEQHYRDPLTLEMVAGEAHLSPNYFSQVFHELVGVTFQQHLQMLRARFASSLLRATDMAITDVCHSSGFRTLSHFERAFKAHFGLSPSAWRRDLRRNGEQTLGQSLR